MVMSCCLNDNGERVYLELNPLVLRGDAGDPVDVRLQQAHRALKEILGEPQDVKNSVMKKYGLNLDEDDGNTEQMRQLLTSSGR